MKEQPIIEIKNISKKYKITHERGGYIALRDVVMNIVKQPFSYLKTKAKSVAGLEKKEDFWALKDVNFTVNKGEVIGIIGRNGAGKSTLLKILSQITPPTEGEIIMRGSVGSLLEVGTGFHPELTGRENIFLNGAILGMGRKEIAEKFDQIVEFADIGKFLDTPVKYYSSGMYVRLAFSVAAHMEPDILLVDEVLAVGDAEFQKKCLGKMGDITKREGRTILFVSHNMGAIQQLCQKTILLKNGNVDFIGQTDQTIKKYSNITINDFDFSKKFNRKGNGPIKLTGFEIRDENNKPVESINKDNKISLNFSYECQRLENVKEVDIGFSISKQNGMLLSTQYSSYTNEKFIIKNIGYFTYKINNLPLAPGTYAIGVRLLVNKQESDWPREPVGFLIIKNTNNIKTYADSSFIINGSWS